MTIRPHTNKVRMRVWKQKMNTPDMMDRPAIIINKTKKIRIVWTKIKIITTIIKYKIHGSYIFISRWNLFYFFHFQQKKKQSQSSYHFSFFTFCQFSFYKYKYQKLCIFVYWYGWLWTIFSDMVQGNIFFCFLNGLAKCLNKMVIYIYLFDKMMMMMMMKRGRARILPVTIQSHKQLVSVRVLRKRFSMVKTKRRRNRYQNIWVD